MRQRSDSLLLGIYKTRVAVAGEYYYALVMDVNFKYLDERKNTQYVSYLDVSANGRPLRGATWLPLNVCGLQEFERKYSSRVGTMNMRARSANPSSRWP